MFDWLKNLFKNPKGLIKMAVDSLDSAVPLLAAELDKIKAREDFTTWTSVKQAQWIVDFIQAYIIKIFKL